MKYTNKILTATSAVALSVGLLMGYAKPVSAADANSASKTTDTNSSSDSKKHQFKPVLLMI